MPREANTRAASGAGSIRQRPDGRWEARVTVGNDPGTGKPIRRSIYGDTQAAVRKQMTAILREIDRGTYLTPQKTTVAQWLDEWLDTFAANKIKPTTYLHYQACIKNYIKPQIGAIELQALRGAHVQKVYNAMTKKGLSGKTVKNCAAVLHKALSVALKQGIIVSNPCDAAEQPKVVQREIAPLRDEDIPKFLEAIEDSPYRNALAVCLLAGLREGELLGLPWSQVAFEKGRITISQQLQREKKKNGAYYIADTTKSGKPRTIEPPPLCFEYLRDEKRRQAQNKLKAGKLWNNSDNLVFTDEMGAHLAIHTFYKYFKKIAASIGRPDARVHDLRHTAATVMIASGADIKSVQDFMGHATASFTLNVYAHTSEQMMKDTAARTQSYYEKLKKA